MRPNIGHADEYIRNTTARAFSLVVSSLGIPSLLPFLGAISRSKESRWACHIGILIAQQIAIMMGCALIYTRCGIEPFDEVLDPLWPCICLHRGKGLAAFLKAISFVIPIMHPEYVSYTKEVTVILIREEMEIALEVVKQRDATEDVTRHSSRPFKTFWAPLASGLRPPSPHSRCPRFTAGSSPPHCPWYTTSSLRTLMTGAVFGDLGMTSMTALPHSPVLNTVEWSVLSSGQFPSLTARGIPWVASARLPRGVIFIAPPHCLWCTTGSPH